MHAYLIMDAYRITHKYYSAELTASGIAGRWNSAGRRVIYCAESIALAFLENMIRRKGMGFNDDFRTITLNIPDDLQIKTIKAEELPPGWRAFWNYSVGQAVGDAWMDEGIYPVLRVPSAVLPDSNNLVINTMHRAFARIRIIKVAELIPDERIEDILKNP